jgi:hypothetical protein
MTQQREGYDQTAEQKPGREAPDFALLAQTMKHWDAAELEILWERYDEIKDAADFRYFLYYCKQNNLDPAAGEVVPAYRWNTIKRREVLTPIVTIGLLRRRRAAECDGIDQFVFQHDGKVLISASGTIHRKACAHPFSATVFYDEYCAVDNRGNINAMWAGKAHMMTSKVLEAQLTRMAFFDLCGEFLIDEETQRGGDDPADQTKTEPADEFVVGEKKPAETGNVVEMKAPEVAATPTEQNVAPETKPEPPKAESQPAPPIPPTLPLGAVKPEPTFEDMIATARAKLGGTSKAADTLIARYFAEYLDIRPVGGKRTIPKDRSKLMPPLIKLIEVIEQRFGDLRADPELLGCELSGRKKSLLDEEFAILKWGPSLCELARAVMFLNGQAERDFAAWLSMPIAGDAQRGTGIAIAGMEPEALQIFLPLYLLVRGKAFQVVDWAIAHNEGILKTLQDMVTASGLPIQKWDIPFAEKVIQAIIQVSQAPASPAPDEDWANAGLPFEEN